MQTAASRPLNGPVAISAPAANSSLAQWFAVLTLLLALALGGTTIVVAKGRKTNKEKTKVVSLVGTSNTEKAFKYFVQRGLSPAQSAGVVGNLIQESGVNPGSNQHGGGPGRGIAQWTVSSRWQTLLRFARERRQNPRSLRLQLDFIWHELQNEPDNGLAQLRSAKSANQAATVFSQKFERPGSPVMSERVAHANRVLKQFTD